MKNIEEITQSEKFKTLIKRRWSFSLMMTALMLCTYFGFIFTVAFKAKFLSDTLYGSTTFAIVIGVLVILLAWIFTGIYVRWANTVYDREVEELKSEITK